MWLDNINERFILSATYGVFLATTEGAQTTKQLFPRNFTSPYSGWDSTSGSKYIIHPVNIMINSVSSHISLPSHAGNCSDKFFSPGRLYVLNASNPKADLYVTNSEFNTLSKINTTAVLPFGPMQVVASP